MKNEQSGSWLTNSENMHDALLLPVTYRGNEYEFRLKIVSSGYVPRYFVWVHEVEVIFERDDEGTFRAIIYNPKTVSSPLPERGLLESIGSTLQQLTAWIDIKLQS